MNPLHRLRPAGRPCATAATLATLATMAALLLALAAAGAAHGQEADGTRFDHQAHVVLSPQEHRLAVEDAVRLPAGRTEVRFALHAGLDPEVTTEGVALEALPGPPTAELLGLPPSAAPWFPPRVPEVTVYALRATGAALPPSVTLRYGGLIHHPLEPAAEEYDRSFSETAGTIQEDGVFLSGATYWLPLFGSGLGSGLDSGSGSERGQGLVRFSLDVELPAGWDAVSEGLRAEHAAGPEGTRVRWVQETQVEDAHLVAAPFTVFVRHDGAVTEYAYLRQDDQALADRYLAAGAQYLTMYDRLIGPYPYPKLALVENFWETGYGMPSFTLLGPTVLRFPFILRSSWPHEILHNWWGNGVFPPADGDEHSGNWSEGLTAYLADHLSKEQNGQGADYRRDLLQKYTDYVRSGNDFPLTAFRSRHSGATAAVGYGKTAMVFHMLRRRLGDAVFIDGLRRFYGDHLGERASFDDLRQAFEAAGGEPLGAFFDAWVRHAGAPRLALTSARAEKSEGGWRLRIGLSQESTPGGGGVLFPLRVPVAVTVDGPADDGATARMVEIDLTGARAEQTFDFARRPLRIAVDPAFDVFRRLDPQEIPPALGGLFGAEKITLVLPERTRDGAPSGLAAAYRDLAAAWGSSRAGHVEVVRDADLDTLPADGAVWVIGWNNRFRPRLAEALQPLGATLDEASLTIGDQTYAGTDRSVVAVARAADAPGSTLGFLAADRPAAVPGLARKLPHYGKYGYLAFTGDAPDNLAKGSWPSVGSPLDRILTPATEPTPAAAPLPERAPLIALPPETSPQETSE